MSTNIIQFGCYVTKTMLLYMKRNVNLP